MPAKATERNVVLIRIRVKCKRGLPDHRVSALPGKHNFRTERSHKYITFLLPLRQSRLANCRPTIISSTNPGCPCEVIRSKSSPPQIRMSFGADMPIRTRLPTTSKIVISTLFPMIIFSPWRRDKQSIIFPFPLDFQIVHRHF